MKWAGDGQKEGMERPGRCRRRFRRLNHSGESGSHIMTLSSGSLAIAQRSNERNVIRACASRENQAGFISFQVFTQVWLKLSPTWGLSREKVTNYFLLSVFLTGYFNPSFNLPFNRLFYRPHFSWESPCSPMPSRNPSACNLF